MPPLAIIGMGCLFPGSSDRAGFWARVVTKADAIRPVPPTHWSPADYHDPDPKAPDKVYNARGAFLEAIPFSPAEFGIPPNDLEATDASQLLGLVAARQAIEDSGYTVGGTGPKSIPRGRIGVILGVTGTLQLVIPLGARLGHPLWRKALREAGVDDATADDVVARIADGYVPWQENSFPGLLGNVVAGRIANRLDLGGTNCVVDAACASSLGAVHLAALELASGRADVVLTGGTDTFNDIFMFTCFSKTPALSPTGDARPFDADGDGTALGEGLGMVVLKRLDDARRHGDRIYAVLRGVGSSSDGKGGAIYAPRKEGQIEALRNAYRSAGISPDTVELVEAHGTGTRVGDATEISALAEVYASSGRSGQWCAVGSIKSQIGHTKAAAGAAGLLKAALALHHKVLPPTIKIKRPLTQLLPDAGPLYANVECRPWMPTAGHPRRAALSAFGFGGSNFHAVLEESSPDPSEVAWLGETITALSGASKDDLLRQLDGERRPFRPDAEWRLVMVGERRDEARKLLTSPPDPLALRAGGETPPDPRYAERGGRMGVYLGHGPAPGSIAVLFPGQGAQAPGMLRDVVCHFPAAFTAFRDAYLAFERETGRRLVDLVYPPPAWDAAGKARQEEALRATDAAQPALGAVCLGAWRVLQSFGVEASLFAGHSYGELVALAAAGRMGDADLWRLSLARGRLMAEASRDQAGAMLAVLAPEERIHAILSEAGLSLTLANKNAPEQTVLSGPAADIEKASAAFVAKGIRAVKLPVAAAFHSPNVSAAETPFRAALAGVAFRPGGRVFANTTAAEYPDDLAGTLAGQLARPVEWARQVEAMYAAGARTFIECGPGSRLCGLADAILAGKGAACRPIDGGVAHLLAWLAARGHPVALERWNPPKAESRRPSMTVQLTGANVVRPRPARPPAAPKPERNGTKMTPRSDDAPKARADDAPPGAMTQREHRSADAPPAALTHPRPPGGDALAQALALTRESLAALQKMQEQASSLHRQFLDGQDATLRAVTQLVEQQQRLLTGQPMPALPAYTAPPPPAPPAPVYVAPPPVIRPRPPEPITPPPAPPAVPVGQASRLPSPPPATPASGGRAQGVLLEVIAEKTGYPADMLGMQMTLDADLGIDSIKRVEILSALQERLPDAPTVKPEHLGTLHTLGDIADFLDQTSATGTHGPLTPGRSPGQSAGPVLLEVIAEKTGYPADMLGMQMTLDADLGIDSIKRVEILSALQERLPDAPTVKPEHLGTLHTLGDIADFLSGPRAVPDAGPTGPAAPERPDNLERFTLAAVPLGPRVPRALTGPVWVGSDDIALSAALAARLRARGLDVTEAPAAELAHATSPPLLGALILTSPPDLVADPYLRDALFAVQSAGPGLRAARGILLTVSRLDGVFGLAGRPWREPLDGALAGLAKTAGHEWPEITSRAIDLAPDFDAAEALENELLHEGPSEVGLSITGAVTLERVPCPPSPGGFVPLRPGDLVVLTGGARGVTAEAAVALARRFRPTLLIMGRSPEPGPEPDWLAGLADEPAIKRELARRTQGRTPREIGEEAKALLAAREVRQNLARLREAGARVLYRAIDIRETRASDLAIVSARQAHGPVRAIIHGAGVLADARLEDKTPAQFDAVWGTKVGGLYSLLASCDPDELRAVVLFSSSTARFGRTGQSDYAMANEALNKLAWKLDAPTRRVVSINWGPWDGGMVTPGLKKLFASEGVGVIPPAAGAELMCDEMCRPPGSAREVVVLARHTPEAPATPAGPLPAALPQAFERAFALDDIPILRDHVLDGRPVLPFALMLEWLAHAAMVANPGFVFHGADGLRVLHGVFLEGEPLTLRLGAAKATRRDGLFAAPAEIRSTRGGREVLHARAEILLANTLPPAPEAAPAPELPPYPHSREEIYRRRLLFHGPGLHAFASLDGMGEAGALATLKAAPPPSTWLRRPLRQHWITDPLALDGCFQLAILWSRQQRGAASLPVHMRRYRQYRKAFPAAGVSALLTVEKAGGNNAVAGLQLSDGAGVVALAEGYEFVLDPSLDRAFARNMAGAT